jgi:hypothetical protein
MPGARKVSAIAKAPFDYLLALVIASIVVWQDQPINDSVSRAHSNSSRCLEGRR